MKSPVTAASPIAADSVSSQISWAGSIRNRCSAPMISSASWGWRN